MTDAASGALDLAASIAPSDARPYQIKYQMLQSHGDIPSRLAAIATIAKYFDNNPSASNSTTIIVFVNEWLSNIEAVGETGAGQSLEEFANVFQRYGAILQSGLPPKRYKKAKELAEKVYG